MNSINFNKEYNYLKNNSNIYNNYSKIVIKNKLLNKDIINDGYIGNLFNKSINYISVFQKNLMKCNIVNYISGGFAFNLYIDKNKLNYNVNDRILITNDCDLILLYDLKKDSINKIIINNIKCIINSAFDFLKNKKEGLLKLYLLINYNNSEDFIYLLNSMFTEGYKLIYYKPNINDNKYIFNFIKIINDSLFIKVEVKFLKMIYSFISQNRYSYGTLNFYHLKRKDNKLQIFRSYIPIELLIFNKNEININLIKGSIIKNDHTFYLYNLKFLIYNYMNLYYIYNSNIFNQGILKKKEKGYLERDERRLFYIIRLYCRNIYKISNKRMINNIFEFFKINDYKFKKYMFKIKNTNIVDDLIKESLIVNQ